MRHPERPIVMLHESVSYCDEFGHPKDPEKKFMGIAGLLAWSGNWSRLSDEWEECLEVEEIPNPFHMTDFLHRSERFSDARWEDEQERMRVLRLLLEIIQRAEVIPIGASVNLKHYNALTNEQKTLCRSPYYLAFQAVTSNMGFAAASIDLDQKLTAAKRAVLMNLSIDPKEVNTTATVSMVYAKLKKFTGPAEELWNAIKDTNVFGAWMSSYTPGEPKDYPPLQAADIWAYSLGHFGEHNPPKKEEAKLALSFFVDRAMQCTHGAHWFTFLDREQILINIGRLNEI
jgi:hypothetical protein